MLGHLRAVFPPAAACLSAQGSSSSPAGPFSQADPAMAGNPMLDADNDEEEEGPLCAVMECWSVCSVCLDDQKLQGTLTLAR